MNNKQKKKVRVLKYEEEKKKTGLNKNLIVTPILFIGLLGTTPVHAAEINSVLRFETWEDGTPASQNFDGTMTNINNGKFKPVEAYTQNQDKKYSDKIKYTSHVTKTVAYGFKDQAGNSPVLNQFSATNSPDDNNYSPNNDEYSYNGYNGQWISQRIPVGGRLVVISQNAGFHNGEYFDIKATIDYDATSYNNNWAILSGRDFLSIPSTNARVKLEFFEHNSDIDISKTIANKVTTSEEVNNIMKNSVPLKFSGSLNFYDFDTPYKKVVLEDQQVEAIEYSDTQKKDGQELGLNIKDGKITVAGTTSGSTSSNNVNHMINVVYNNQHEIDYQSLSYNYNETASLTDIALKFAPQLPGIARVSENEAVIDQYLPKNFKTYDTSLFPYGDPQKIVDFSDKIVIEKPTFIKLNITDVPGYSSTKENKNKNTEITYKINPEKLEAYGNVSALSVTAENTLPSSLADLTTEQQDELLKYFNPNSKFIELPVHFFYKVEDKESELKNNDKLKVKLSDEQLNGIYEIVKVQAEKDIDAEVKKVNDLINTDPTLSVDEKTAQKEAVQKEAEKAKQTIDTAKDLDGVNQSKADGIKAIDDQHKSGNPIENRKDQAKQDIDVEAKKVSEAIDADPTLGADEKTAQKEAVQKEAEKAKQTIDAAKDLDGVNQSKADGIKAIDDQHKSGNPIESRKDQAKQDIDVEAKKVSEAIDADPTLSVDEKTAQKEAVNQEAEKAKQTIDAAKDLDGVNQSKADGIKAIDDQHKSGNAVSDKKIQTIENIDKRPKEHAQKSENSKKFPQTGEKSMSNIPLIGSLISLISGLGILLFRKRNGEKEERRK